MHIEKHFALHYYTRRYRDIEPFLSFLRSRYNERSSAEDGNRDKFSIIECIYLCLLRIEDRLTA